MREAGDHKALMKANGRYAQLISNYQMEQSKVKKTTYSTNLSAVLNTCLTLVVYTSYKTFLQVFIVLPILPAQKP